MFSEPLFHPHYQETTKMEAKVARVDDLKDGQMMKVIVGERAVLLARLDGSFYATGAICPHYGGTLTDGLLHEGWVMCPLHQATFDVKTGHVLEPPPLNGIPRFDVRVDGADVYVNVPDDVPERVPSPMVAFDPQADGRTFVVVGGGAGAAAAVEALRQDGYQGRIVIISPEDRWPYDRPNLSKGYLAGDVPASWLPLRPARFYQEHGIERMLDRVTELDVRTRAMKLESGGLLTPDAVLIATGGTPRKLDVPGADLPGVFTLRSRADGDAILAALPDAKRAVVVGASFIGMETASGLRTRGLAVTVVMKEAVPFERTLGKQVGTMLRKFHEEKGVVFHAQRQVRQFEGGGKVGGVELDDGTKVPTDLVVVGIGVRPATDFVKGVPLNADGSLDVDEQFRVMGSERVWATGDIARFPYPFGQGRARIEHWRVALQHGRAAARSMAGRGEPFRGVPFFWTAHYGTSVRYAGYAPQWDEVFIVGDLDQRKFLGYYVQNDRLVAAVGTLNRHLLSFSALLRLGRLPTPAALRGQPPDEITHLLEAMNQQP
jgi:NADPH-dependent 2,4-dienoyl-CoA reductase/sulfur reductase-like enzyme/nitrite reductase/ring-hydroxylating ferredoxin subunit